MSKSLMSIASRYAEKLGFHVFPLKERSKLPATDNGFYDASNDIKIVEDLWSKNSQYNIGLRTGKESGVFVLDVDGEDGETDLAELEKQHGKLPKTTTQKTSNGRHLIFKYPEGVEIGNRARLAKRKDATGGLDVRGTGGYIVLAPSIHPDTGEAYEWTHKPSTTPPVAAPEWLIELIRKKEPTITSIADRPRTASSQLLKSTSPDTIIADQIKAISEAPNGTRNHTLNIAALKCGRVVAGCQEVNESEVLNSLLSAAIGCGLEHAESEATIISGFNAGLAQPYQYGGKPATANVANPTNQPKKQIQKTDGEKTIERPLTFLSISQIMSRPKTEWLIKGIFPKESFGVIYGSPKKGKSFVALDMGLCVASGRPWAGFDCQQGAVLYIAGEGVGGLPRRLKAWFAHNEVENKDLPFLVLPSAVNFMKEECVQELTDQVLSTGLSFSLIFVDTVARSILGADENSSEHMGFFVAACDSIKAATGATVVGVHHAGKDETRGMRGSSALLGAVDTCLMVTRDEDVVTIKMEAQKDGEEIEDISFKMVNIATGIDETSIALEVVENKTKEKKLKLSAKDLKALQILHDTMTSSTDSIRGFPACQIEAWRSECYRRELTYGDQEAKRSGFRASVNSLSAKGIIIMESCLVMPSDSSKRGIQNHDG